MVKHLYEYDKNIFDHGGSLGYPQFIEWITKAPNPFYCYTSCQSLEVKCYVLSEFNKHLNFFPPLKFFNQKKEESEI